MNNDKRILDKDGKDWTIEPTITEIRDIDHDIRFIHPFDEAPINGGMLTGSEIAKQFSEERIIIEPYSLNRINPNSYNVRFANKLLVYSVGPLLYFDYRIQHNNVYTLVASTNNKFIYRYTGNILNMRKNNPTQEIIIPDDGITLYPGVLYIGRTVERVGSNYFIPCIDGRSSGGRNGLSVHICAGFGDIGFDGTWTLEITVVEPLTVYHSDEIAQVSFYVPCGDTDIKYNGKYQHQLEPTASRFYKEGETK